MDNMQQMVQEAVAAVLKMWSCDKILVVYFLWAKHSSIYIHCW